MGSNSPEHLVPHGLDVPRVLTLDEPTEVVLDDEGRRLSADGDANTDAAIVGLDFDNHRSKSFAR